MEKITQQKLAGAVNISQAHLSRILNGVVPCGRKTCEKFADFAGGQWIDYAIMQPEEIEKRLTHAANSK